MCDYCGCRQQPIIARFARDHEELMHRARIIAEADPTSTEMAQQLTAFGALLDTHSAAEEAGIYTRLRADPRSRDVVDTLEAEHHALRERLGRLVLGTPGSAEAFGDIAAALRRHIEIEEYDIFPASRVYLGPEDWEVLESAGPEASPS